MSPEHESSYAQTMSLIVYIYIYPIKKSIVLIDISIPCSLTQKRGHTLSMCHQVSINPQLKIVPSKHRETGITNSFLLDLFKLTTKSKQRQPFPWSAPHVGGVTWRSWNSKCTVRAKVIKRLLFWSSVVCWPWVVMGMYVISCCH